MRIVRRLYLKDFFRLLVLITLGLAFIFSLIEMIGRLDDFGTGRGAFAKLVLYTAFTIPKFLLYLLPMSVLVCSLFTFSQAFRRGEITAIRAAGGQLRKLALPFVTAGVLLSLFSFVIGEFLVPDFGTRAADLKAGMEGKGRQALYKEGVIWLKAKDGSPVRIDFYAPEEKTAKGMTIFLFGNEFLKATIAAQTAVWNGSAWKLTGVVKSDFETGVTKKFSSMAYADLDSPDVFTSDLKSPNEMGIVELSRYIKRLKNAGFSNTKLSVDLQSKISFPLINAFMMLLGLSLAMRGRMTGGLVTAGLGLLISLFYWLGYTFTLSLGYAGILPALAAAWITPCAFGGLALYLFKQMPE
ncbi:MAG: LPS export ABC transporter permease LptG [Thermodesulfovibrionales bacterium]